MTDDNTNLNRCMIGYVHSATVHASFAQCLLRDTLAEHKRILGHRTALSSANVSFGRNLIVREFLKQDHVDWLLMIDTDMVWKPGVISRMLDIADPDTVPVLGALAFGMASFGELTPFPTMYGTQKDANGNIHFDRVVEFPEDTLCPVAGTGAAFLLVHRGAFEAIPERDDDMFRWFAEERIEGHMIGEDLVFCRRLGEAGVPIYVHTGISVGHIKHIIADAELYHAQRTVQQALALTEKG